MQMTYISYAFMACAISSLNVSTVTQLRIKPHCGNES
jgi:hypothetical protein